MAIVGHVSEVATWNLRRGRGWTVVKGLYDTNGIIWRRQTQPQHLSRFLSIEDEI
jgi:hypothetical protein